MSLMDVLKLAQKNGRHLSSDDAVYKFFRGLNPDHLKQDSSVQLLYGKADAGDVIYIPAGWIVADVTGESDAVGVRTSIFSKADICSGNVEAFLKLTNAKDPSNKNKKGTDNLYKAAMALQ